MDNGCFIPKRIRVGYQYRNDTYSGKLAYVIYYDEKNKIRKEPSWNSWRDANIEPQEFDNEPMDGFVLNKKAGDYSDWYHRQAYIRVFDPRGFEIEITVNNLLYILENCDSIKGKGLIGRFCYGYIGKDLVLLPECSQSYKESMKYTETLCEQKKIKKNELVEGKTYILRGNEEVVYLGYNPEFSSYCYNMEGNVERSYCGFKHYYVLVSELKDWSNDKYHYFFAENNFNPIAVSDNQYEYSQVLEELNKKIFFTGRVLCFYNEKEIKEILKKCNEGFSCNKIRDSRQYYRKVSNDTVIYQYRNAWRTEDLKMTVKELVKYHDLWYIGNFINGSLVSKEENLEIV